MIIPKEQSYIIALGLSNREVRCQCTRPECYETIIADEFIPIWVSFRRMMGCPLRINSMYRCYAHNAEVPGSNPKSAHMRGMAIDINYPPSLRTKFKVEEVKALAHLCGFKFVKYYEDRKFFHLQVDNV